MNETGRTVSLSELCELTVAGHSYIYLDRDRLCQTFRPKCIFPVVDNHMLCLANRAKRNESIIRRSKYPKKAQTGFPVRAFGAFDESFSPLVLLKISAIFNNPGDFKHVAA